MAKTRHILKRIDIDLAKQIQDYAEKNDVSFRRASQEISKLTKIKLSGKKVFKEIRI